MLSRRDERRKRAERNKGRANTAFLLLGLLKKWERISIGQHSEMDVRRLEHCKEDKMIALPTQSYSVYNEVSSCTHRREVGVQSTAWKVDGKGTV